MVGFQDLPLEIHYLIARECQAIGPGTLSKYLMIERETYQIAYPLQASSVDLSRIEGGLSEENLQLFIHDFAPLHRTSLTCLSLPLGRTGMTSYHSIEDPLDELFSDILSLLPLLSTLRLSIPTGSATESLDEGDFTLTLLAAQNLNHLSSLTLFGTHPCPPTPEPALPPSSQFFGCFLSDLLPKLKSFRHLTLSQLSIPAGNWPSRAPFHIISLNFYRCQLLPTSLGGKGSSSFSEFINLFSPALQSLTIIQTCEFGNSPRPVTAPQLAHLTLFVLPGPRLPSHVDLVEGEEKMARKILQCFFDCPLTSIKLDQQGVMKQFHALRARGGFKSFVEARSR